MSKLTEKFNKFRYDSNEVKNEIQHYYVFLKQDDVEFDKKRKYTD